MNDLSRPNNRFRYSSGFTAVEVLISIVFAGIMILTVSMIYTTINKINGGSRDLILATEAAKSQIDKFRSMDFDLIPTGGTETAPVEIDFTPDLPQSLPGPKSGTLKIATRSKTVKSVRAVVKFQGSSGERTITQAVRLNDVTVIEGDRVESVSAGGAHSCALYNYVPYCWGANSGYRLGNASVAVSTPRPTPVDRSGILGSKTVTAISAGSSHSCAVADGEGYCWGYADAGRLGNGINADIGIASPTPVIASGALANRTMTSISAGLYHTCAVADWNAICWGSNYEGQIGNGSSGAGGVLEPYDVSAGSILSGKRVTDISTGGWFSCAVATGKPYCWGSNGDGQLGDNTLTSSLVPVAVDTSGVLSGKTVTDIDAGKWHTCAVADGKAYCWGYNGDGQLGNNSTTSSSVPVAVDTSGVLAGKTVTDIAAGKWHTCAIADGKAYCWGYNGYGLLGDEYMSGDASMVPVAVYDMGVLKGKELDHISTSEEHTCAGTDNQAVCWGRGGAYRHGQGNLNPFYEPGAVIKDW